MYIWPNFGSQAETLSAKQNLDFITVRSCILTCYWYYKIVFYFFVTLERKRSEMHFGGPWENLFLL